MTTILQETFRSYRVPREHGSWLIDPPLETSGEILSSNQQASDGWELQIGDDPVAQFRNSARRELFELAVGYVRAYRDLPDACTACHVDQPFVLAGHQPELFHPGVWFKNFVLSGMGQTLGATTINLIVDNDVCRTRGIRVPTLEGDSPATETLAFDSVGKMVPYEMAAINDRKIFDAFGRNVANAVTRLIDDPAVSRLWPLARQAANRTGNVGLSLAQARHQLEGDIGLQTLELPVSQMSQSQGFNTFVLHLVSDMPRLHDCYNTSVVEYRRAHHIRSNSHPVPELSQTGGWYEAPLWIYDAENPQRRALFVRATRSGMELSDLDRIQISLPGGKSANKNAIVLQEKLGDEVRLRPRALVTTMYSRLILSDLFLHGIGGGKYDQLNDTIIRRLFHVPPPQFTVLSATFTPLSESIDTTESSPDEIRQTIRRTYFQPEHFIDDADLPVEEVHEKHDLLSNIPPRGEKKAWHDRMTTINRELSLRLSDVRRDLVDQLRHAQRRETERRLLASRDYSFCIYPLEDMQQMFSDLS